MKQNRLLLNMTFALVFVFLTLLSFPGTTKAYRVNHDYKEFKGIYYNFISLGIYVTSQDFNLKRSDNGGNLL